MTEAEKLAALSDAATQIDPAVLVVRAVLHAHQRAMTPPDSGWGNMSYAKGSYDHLPVFQAALAAYRANQLVLIGPDAVEKVARAICNAHCEEMYGTIDSHMVENEWADWIPEARAALAALGVK